VKPNNEASSEAGRTVATNDEMDETIKRRWDEMKLPLNPSGRPCGWTPWKLRGCRLQSIPLLSLTLQLSTHQEWERNKPGMK
jgi:hypothetical protein